MTNFGHLAQLDVKRDETREYPFTAIEVNGVSPVLHVVHAGESNKTYFNELLKRGNRNQRQIVSGKITTALIEDNRDENRKLYAKYVVKGWDETTVLDAAGKPVKFTAETCGEFLDALPDWLFDQLTSFCSDALNFVGDTAINVGDVGNV
jgi:hypothetical protein